jgi:hypothetical protein
MCGNFDPKFNFTTPFLVGANVPIKFVVVGEFVLLLLLLLNLGTSKFNIQKLRDRSTDEKKNPC